MNPALLVIDIQRWFFKVGAPEKISGLPTLLARSNELIDFFHHRNLPIVHVLTLHKADGSTGDLSMRRANHVCMVAGTPDAEEYPEIHRFDTDVVLTKTRHSAFIRTKLETVLRKRGVDAVVLAGFSTNACVGLTAMDAYERDFDVLLAGEAILGCDQPRADVMLRLLKAEFAFEPLPNSVIMARVHNVATDRAG